MNILLKHCLSLLFFSFYCYSIAQPNYIYEGGIGAGYSSETFAGTSTKLFEGGGGCGYLMDIKIIGNSYLFDGGISDGFFSLKWKELNDIFYFGSDGSGYASSKKYAQQNTLFKGGNNDGYSMVEKCEDFIWTGALGTGWAVTDNWNYSIIPDLKRRAIIPAGVPFFPFVNAGIFAIGDNPNNGAFECGQLWIQEGAQLVTRVNNNVENYGKIIIDGTMRVKKSTIDAFQNIDGGLVRVSSTGNLIIKP